MRGDMTLHEAVNSFDELLATIERDRDNYTKRAAELSPPDSTNPLHLKIDDHRSMGSATVTKSSRPDAAGRWQVTRFDHDGGPLGHYYAASPHEGVLKLFRDFGVKHDKTDHMP